MNILIIPGHGAGDPGACSGSLQEAALTRALAGQLCALLPESTTLYDTSRNAFKDVTAGRLTAKSFKAYDWVVELHFNAVKADKGDGKVKGVECWVPTEAADTKLAKALCAAVQSLGFTNRGVKRKNFSVIYTAHKAGVPALLLELCFLDDADDMALYDPHKAAAAIAEALTEHFGLHTDPAWAWCAERGLVSGAADAAITAGALARALYKLHGGEK